MGQHAGEKTQDEAPEAKPRAQIAPESILPQHRAVASTAERHHVQARVEQPEDPVRVASADRVVDVERGVLVLDLLDEVPQDERGDS